MTTFKLILVIIVTMGLSSALFDVSFNILSLDPIWFFRHNDWHQIIATYGLGWFVASWVRASSEG